MSEYELIFDVIVNKICVAPLHNKLNKGTPKLTTPRPSPKQRFSRAGVSIPHYPYCIFPHFIKIYKFSRYFCFFPFPILWPRCIYASCLLDTPVQEVMCWPLSSNRPVGNQIT